MVWLLIFPVSRLIGVSILVKGTSNGTVTDLDGKFSLSAEMGNMLQISYVGYISQEIKVESNKLLRIIMEEDTKKLEEVVVVGYGTQKKGEFKQEPYLLFQLKTWLVSLL